MSVEGEKARTAIRRIETGDVLGGDSSEMVGVGTLVDGGKSSQQERGESKKIPSFGTNRNRMVSNRWFEVARMTALRQKAFWSLAEDKRDI